MKGRNILFVATDVPYDVRANWIPGGDRPAIDRPGVMTPLALATLCALTPEAYHIDIWDESIHGKIDENTAFARKYDLIGFTGYIQHLPRVKEIIPVLRERCPDVLIAAGGAGVSAAPHLMSKHCDIIFMGEAELTWPQFLKDWEAGNTRKIYRQIDKPDIAESPIPKWDCIKDIMTQYAMGAVQTTRGCPFDCEFCDVIYLYGRRPRHKPIERVLEEIRVLQKLGVDAVFISDDEFVGDPRYAKEFLQKLIPLNNSFLTPLRYRAQVTMNLSKDEEMLELMADANFDMAIIGIESPNEASLKETGKYQNIRKDLVADVHKILSYGIGIRSGHIVGFDSDGPDIFDIQFDFIQAACIPVLSLCLLKAPIGTRLWTRKRKEDRMLNWTTLAEGSKEGLNKILNIIPGSMSRVELMRGFCDLMEKINSWENYGKRVRGMVSLVKREPRVREDPMDLENLLTLGKRLNVEPEGCEEIRKIFCHVHQTAPFMWRKVRSFTANIALWRREIPHVVETIRKTADAEDSGILKIELEDQRLSVPQCFIDKYKSDIFPQIYRRAYLNLEDKNKLAEVLTEVFVDFLIHWNERLTEVTEPHLEEMIQLTDRSSAKANGVPPQDFVPDHRDDAEVEKPVPFFYEEVLKGVAQELIAIARGTSLREPGAESCPSGLDRAGWATGTWQ